MYRSGPIAPVVSGGVRPVPKPPSKLGDTFAYPVTVGPPATPAVPEPPPPRCARLFAAAFARANSFACNGNQPLGARDPPPCIGDNALANRNTGTPAAAG